MKNNHQELPYFLTPFASELAIYQKEYLRINATPLDVSPIADPLKLDESKFLGLPFLPKTRSYPKDKERNYMIMVAQLN